MGSRLMDEPLMAEPDEPCPVCGQTGNRCTCLWVCDCEEYDCPYCNEQFDGNR